MLLIDGLLSTTEVEGVTVPVRRDIEPVASEVSKLMLARVEAADPVWPEPVAEVRVVVTEFKTVTVFVVLPCAMIRVGRLSAKRVVRRILIV